MPRAVGPLVDSHCHLDMLDDRAAALAEAARDGVAAVVAVGIDLASSAAAAEAAAAEPRVWATVGVHPHEAASLDDAALARLEELARRPRVVAVGECGLDYYRDLAPRERQREAFLAQVGLARRLGLPLVVHVREAADDALALLDREAGDLTVVLHCFSLADRLDECLARGWYLSFAGNVTYRNAGDLRAAAARVPADRLLVETDAPFLAPVPRRGRRNRPAWLVHTARLLAEVRGEPPAALAAATTENARRVFGITLEG